MFSYPSTGIFRFAETVPLPSFLDAQQTKQIQARMQKLQSAARSKDAPQEDEREADRSFDWNRRTSSEKLANTSKTPQSHASSLRFRVIKPTANKRKPHPYKSESPRPRPSIGNLRTKAMNQVKPLGRILKPSNRSLVICLLYVPSLTLSLFQSIIAARHAVEKIPSNFKECHQVY